MLNWPDFVLFAKEHLTNDSILISILSQLKLSKQEDNSITLVCPTAGTKFYGDKKKLEIETILQKYSGKNYTVTLDLQSKPKPTKKTLQETPLITYQSDIETILLRNGFQPKHSFHNFAVSSSNQIAFAAAQAVADNPGKTYNPLFIYGGVGVGKTHLAQAVGQAIINKKGASCKATFSPGDDFTNELIEAIRFKKTTQFRQKYRKIDLLIVDDVQFIAGKNSIQEEFFHTFNSIIANGGQIILTSDRPPHDIQDVEDRLRSRFAGGLTIDIQPPDMELRSAILLIKASDKNINITLDAVRRLAEQVTDTRSLEGMLVSIYAKTSPIKDKIEESDIVGFFSKPTSQSQKSKTNEADVIKTVSLFFNIKPSQIKAATRKSDIAFARQVIMHILRNHLGFKLEDIARILKRKDHTTIIHGCEKIKTLIMKNPQIKEQVNIIIQSLE